MSDLLSFMLITVLSFFLRFKIIREALDSLDLFVGRYLVPLSSIYVSFKFLHYKMPDFPAAF